ncbi:hypothetical protein BDV98DRAFT_406297 [Pterulicium gracile]|uniref:Uncharacterized protein n=1 Tax=Pterulicium gracile TaxID=1884261 RepID=A0A5C3QLF9_9AGAR|nr:hypothetical protein BDV98DRAFT_406297 [Pterula gracilis]
MHSYVTQAAARSCWRGLRSWYGVGSLSVVTGHLKCKTWATAALYRRSSTDSGQLTFRAYGREASLSGSSAPYRWGCTPSTLPSPMSDAAGQSESGRRINVFSFVGSAFLGGQLQARMTVDLRRLCLHAHTETLRFPIRLTLSMSIFYLRTLRLKLQSHMIQYLMFYNSTAPHMLPKGSHLTP